MTYVGIDVSKDTFTVAYSSDKNSKTKTFKNTVKGIHEFIQTVSKEDTHCVLEATGNYSALLVYLLLWNTCIAYFNMHSCNPF